MTRMISLVLLKEFWCTRRSRTSFSDAVICRSHSPMQWQHDPIDFCVPHSSAITKLPFGLHGSARKQPFDILADSGQCPASTYRPCREEHAGGLKFDSISIRTDQLDGYYIHTVNLAPFATLDTPTALDPRSPYPSVQRRSAAQPHEQACDVRAYISPARHTGPYFRNLLLRLDALGAHRTSSVPYHSAAETCPATSDT